MSQDFRRVTTDDLNEQLCLEVEARLKEIISDRQPGHCMRVGDLDASVMLTVAKRLRESHGTVAQVHVLSRDVSSDSSLLITSSKLVELRNPLKDGEQRPPLLVFVPNDLRTAAEDSFAEATFEQVSVADSYQRLRERLIQEQPEQVRGNILEVLRVVEEREWRWADFVDISRFLLSIQLNGSDSEVVGASLCELGLIPDFHLLENVSTIPNRLTKNIECVEILTFSTRSERGRVLDLKLSDRTFRSKLGEFLFDTGIENPLVWTGRIVVEKALRVFSFDKWQFEDGAGFTQQLRVEVIEVGLPVVQDDEADARLRQLVGQQVLLIGRNGPKSFKVKFRSDPAPESAPAIDHYRVQIVSRESGPTAFTKKKNSWEGSRKDASVSFSKLATIDWEDGWHFVRVLPCTAEGDPIPIVDAQGQAIPLLGNTDAGQAPNESDLFYVVRADDVEVEVPQRAVPKFASFTHALIHCWFKAVGDGRDPKEVACTHHAWVEGEDHKGRNDLLEFKFAGEGMAHVPIARALRILEQRILASPDGTLSWRLSISPAQAVDIFDDGIAWPDLPELESFRAIRRELFLKLRGDDGEQVIEGVDLSKFRDQIATYAECYLTVLSRSQHLAERAAPDQQTKALVELQRLLTLDTAAVDLTDHSGGHRTALLIGPTHPLAAR